MTKPTNNNNIDPFFLQFVSNAFGEYAHAKGNITIVCPICMKTKNEGYSKRKLAIRLSDHVVHCWVCGYRSPNLVGLLKARRGPKELLSTYLSSFLPKGSVGAARGLTDDEMEGIEEPVRLPNDFQLLATKLGQTEDEDYWIVKKHFAYLKKRGLLNKQDLWYWKFGISTGKDNKEFWNRIIIPSFDEEGELNYWTARGINNKMFPRYYNPDSVKRKKIIFNEININWARELVLVEGPFDLFKCPDNATCVLGSEIKEDFRLFQKIVENDTPIVIAFDSDAKQKTLKLAKLLREYSIPVKIAEIPSTFEDVGAMTKKQFKEVLEHNTMSYSTTDLLSRKIQSIIL